MLARSNVFAFNATNGAISTNFAPSVNGQVRAVEAGPTPGTVYVGGSFQGVNGVNRKVVLMDLASGQILSSFNAPAMNGAVNDLSLVGDRLYVAGVFTTVGGQPHQGLVTLNADTGARENFLQVALTENHNYTGQPGQARAPVGAKAIAVNPQGTQMAVVGNFRRADGLERRQMVLIDLTGQQAAVREDWRTDRYAASCAANAFDTYMRDIEPSPDGSYFTVATTGGPFPGSLCDTATRWDIAASGQSVQPTWLDDSGGDTLYSATPSGAAVYTGGHQRWHNNAGGRDFPAPGAVPRPGLGGLDMNTGVPLAWNPGRHPRGVGAESIVVTEDGLWVGSDTEFIGNFRYRRPRLSFFPLQGGAALGSGETGSLPSNVYLAGPQPAAAVGDVLYRVNAGGPEVASGDGGMSWSADNGTTNPLRNSGSNAASWSPSAALDGSIPDGTPVQLFDTERWDPGSRNDGGEMTWAFPVPAGEEVVVRLYFANRCTCTTQPGQRNFDVTLEGNPVLDTYDIAADVGDGVGTMKSFEVTSDGTIDLQWLHRTENPLVNAIEIAEVAPEGEPQPEPSDLSRVWYGGAQVTNPVEPAPEGDVDWAEVRGAVVIDGELFYGTSAGGFVRRSFDGATYGAAEQIDPYNDPYWSGVETGSGQTYRGTLPSFYSQIPSLTGMAYDDGRLYYTRSGQNRIYSRGFSPDSGVIRQQVVEVPGFAPANLGGIFLDEAAENLYFVNRATGSLSRVGWADGTVVGAPVVVSGPDIDDMDWRGRAAFLADGPAPAPNEVPTAVFDVSCDRLDCAFDGSASTDADGEIVDYLWDFGDGTTSTEVAPTHTFEEGSYTVTLTVTDNRGAIGASTSEVDVVANEGPTAEIAEPVCDRLECTFDGSASSDPDDSVVSYSWDFGDGSPGQTREQVMHEFTAEGSYVVTLTVEDEFGATDTAEVEIDVLANQAPVAVVGEPVCDLLECVFDGSQSSDPDGGDSVVAWSWDFGDGSAAASGESVSHEFPEAGVYTVELTVTDEEGATGSVTYEVTVTDGSGPVLVAPELVGQASEITLQSFSSSVVLPEEVQAGDLLTMFVTTNWADVGSAPQGVGEWQEQERVISGQLAVSVYTRIADGSEADAQVSVDWPRSMRTDMTVVAYRGVGETPVELVASEIFRSTATSTTPVVSVEGDSRVALSFWADRSSSTTEWTAPEEVDVISTSIGSGGGRVTTLLGRGPADEGDYGGLSATTNEASGRSVAMTLVLAPQEVTGGPPANQAPVAVVGEPVCDLLECVFDGSQSSDPDGGDSVVAWSWDFGDGSAAASGESVSHEFPEAGVYTVELTVTDEEGATGSVTYEVTVTDGSGPVLVAPELVGQASEITLQSFSSSVVLPEEVQAGDLLTMFVTTNWADVGSAPQGVGEWQEQERVISGQLAVSVYTRIADGSEADAQVSVDWPRSMRTDMTVVAYRGVGETPVELVASEIFRSTATSTTPVVSVEGDSRVALSFWADRSSSTTEWTAPEEVDVISTSIGSGGGRVTTLLGRGPADEGDYGGLSATTNEASGRSVAMTLVLAPQEVTG
ncbi:PKD domain-containing protein [Serinicoccus marinus]|uniref:PKD domain-containing protein n=1 Tax=Serinicoccus marinus TaxID=247333 RepID=UPI00248F5431|nr:PKD domain-containing protein [Serinicoccus marinus]